MQGVKPYDLLERNVVGWLAERDFRQDVMH